MSSRRRSWPLAVVATLLAVGASGCSSTSPSPGSSGGGGAAAEAATSPTELCGALTDFQADLADADATDPTAYVAQLQAAATRLRGVGLPEDMPAAARAGFTGQLDAIASLPAAATQDDLATVGQAAADPALETYLSATCPSS